MFRYLFITDGNWRIVVGAHLKTRHQIMLNRHMAGLNLYATQIFSILGIQLSAYYHPHKIEAAVRRCSSK